MVLNYRTSDGKYLVTWRGKSGQEATWEEEALISDKLLR